MAWDAFTNRAVSGPKAARTAGSASSAAAYHWTLGASAAMPRAFSPTAMTASIWQLSRQYADGAVGRDGKLPQLPHVAQHGQTAAGRRDGQQLQGLGHSLRVGVITVIDEQATLRQVQHPHAGAGRDIGGHAGGDLRRRQTQDFSDGGGHSHGVDHVRPGGRGVQTIAAPGGGDSAGDTLDAAVVHVCDADLTALPPAAAQDGLGQGNGVQQRIVTVEDGKPVRRQVFKYLALGLQDALPACCPDFRCGHRPRW